MRHGPIKERRVTVQLWQGNTSRRGARRRAEGSGPRERTAREDVREVAMGSAGVCGYAAAGGAGAVRATSLRWSGSSRRVPSHRGFTFSGSHRSHRSHRSHSVFSPPPTLSGSHTSHRSHSVFRPPRPPHKPCNPSLPARFHLADPMHRDSHRDHRLRRFRKHCPSPGAGAFLP
jgi:hypothetical protein